MKYIQPNWPAPRRVKAYTTTRQGWHGNKLARDIREHYPELQLPEEPHLFIQKHTTIALEAHEKNNEQIADASYTSVPQQICTVLSADCLPIFLCHQTGSHVAAIHAGWRGLAAGILEATVHALQQPTQALLAWLGPAIGPEKFEVGQDVYDAFTLAHPASATAFLPYREGKWLANIYELARIRLQQLGVSQITGGEFCTYTQSDLFFSHRRDPANTGRMASFIWIDKD